MDFDDDADIRSEAAWHRRCRAHMRWQASIGEEPTWPTLGEIEGSMDREQAVARAIMLRNMSDPS